MIGFEVNFGTEVVLCIPQDKERRCFALYMGGNTLGNLFPAGPGYTFFPIDLCDLTDDEVEAICMAVKAKIVQQSN